MQRRHFALADSEFALLTLDSNGALTTSEQNYQVSNPMFMSSVELTFSTAPQENTFYEFALVMNLNYTYLNNFADQPTFPVTAFKVGVFPMVFRHGLVTDFAGPGNLYQRGENEESYFGQYTRITRNLGSLT